MGTGNGVLYRDAALADGRSAQLRVGVSVLVENDRITWIRPAHLDWASLSQRRLKADSFWAKARCS